MYAFYSSTTEFYVAGNYAGDFNTDRRVKFDCGVDGIRYAAVSSSNYAAPSTYITIDEATVTSNITDVWLGVVQPGVSGSLPIHSHTDAEGEGGPLTSLSGALQSNIDTNSADIAVNTTSISTNAAYLQEQIETVSGTIANFYEYTDTASGTLNAKIDTTSGTLQVQLDTLSGTVANLDPLPTQSGNSGKFLTTDGIDASWATVSGLGGGGGGTSSAYGTMWITAGVMVPTTTSGAQAGTNEYSPNDINIDHYAFAKASEEYCEFDIVMPAEWDLGTIKAKFYWSSATGSTAGDDVEWEISAAKVTDSTAIGAISGTSQVITDTLLANNGTDLQITAATPSITVGGTPAIGNMIHFKVSRNISGTDDMTEDAWLLGVLIQYYKDAVGEAW